MRRATRWSLLVLFFLPTLLAPVLTKAQVTFFSPPTYTVGGPPLFVADFNGDGKPDLLGCTVTCSLQLGNGDGTFGNPISVPGIVLAVADFNGDGKPDLLEQGTGTLIVLLGNGDGTFGSPITTNSGAGTLLPVVVGDLRGNGINDVLALYNNNLVAFLGKGNGTFVAPPASYSVGNTSIGNQLVTLGDFNGDGKLDAAVSLGGDNPTGQELVFLGNGDGTFQTTPKTSTGVSLPSSVVAADFNGDGKLDLVIAGQPFCTGTCPPTVTVILLGNGDGTFQAPVTIFSGAPTLAVADLNGDNKPDLVAVGALIQIYLGNGDGTFTNPYSYEPSNAGGSGVVIADFNQDGKLDIAANGLILLGNGNGSFQGQPGVFAPSFYAATGDFDKNGTQDVASVSGTTLAILSNDGTGVLTVTHTYTLQDSATGIAAADLNGDGNLDLIVTGENDSGGSYSILLGNGDGSFQPPVRTPVGIGNPVSIVIADFNNDHIPDLAFSDAEGNSAAVLLGNGDGTFGTANYYFDGGGTPLVAADFNGDGNIDLASSNVVNDTNEFAVLFGKGDGTFQPAAFPSAEQVCAASFAADLNGDGKLDLVGLGSSGIQVCLGNGDGTFTPLPAFGAGGYSVYSGVNAVADMNGDGILDLIGFQSVGSGFRSITDGVSLGNGDGTFGPFIPAYFFSSLGFPNTFQIVADMNGDHKPDLVFGTQSGIVFVLLNTTGSGFGVLATALSPALIQAGHAAASTVTVNSNFGFSGTVSLSCSGLPSGASCSFKPGSIAKQPGSSALTATTTSSTPGGNYSFSVNGTSGALKESVALNLTVQGFTISATAPSPASVTAGGSATSTITFAAEGGFNDTVDLSCSTILLNGSPATKAPPTCTFKPPFASPDFVSSTLTVSTTANTALLVPSSAHPAGLYFAMLVPLFGISLIGTSGKRKEALRSLLLCLSISGMILITSCGGGNNGGGGAGQQSNGTPPGTYTITISATGESTSLTQTTTVTLTVQ